MNSPPLAEFLDRIKEMYEGSEIPAVYHIVKIPTRCDGSDFVVREIEIAYNYDDLCVKMFDLDVSGWEISEGISSETLNSYLGSPYNAVTIHMTRLI